MLLYAPVHLYIGMQASRNRLVNVEPTKTENDHALGHTRPTPRTGAERLIDESTMKAFPSPDLRPQRLGYRSGVDP